jgi:hypothetical protein
VDPGHSQSARNRAGGKQTKKKQKKKKAKPRKARNNPLQKNTYKTSIATLDIIVFL